MMIKAGVPQRPARAFEARLDGLIHDASVYPQRQGHAKDGPKQAGKTGSEGETGQRKNATTTNNRRAYIRRAEPFSGVQRRSYEASTSPLRAI